LFSLSAAPEVYTELRLFSLSTTSTNAEHTSSSLDDTLYNMLVK